MSSSALNRALGARPEEFHRKRSVGTTVTGAVLGAFASLIVIWALLDFTGFRDFVQIKGSTGIYAVKANGAPYFAIPVGLALAIISFRWAIGKHGAWVRTPTGTELRELVSVGISGDRAYRDELVALVSTGNPIVFAPLPSGAGGNIQVDIYVADTDRVAYAVVADRRASRDEQRAVPPLTIIDGQDFEALDRARATGQLVRPAGYTPLQGDTL